MVAAGSTNGRQPWPDLVEHAGHAPAAGLCPLPDTFQVPPGLLGGVAHLVEHARRLVTGDDVEHQVSGHQRTARMVISAGLPSG